MKKALVLTYDYPPYVSVGGLRPYAWCKCFYEFKLYCPREIKRNYCSRKKNKIYYLFTNIRILQSLQQKINIGQQVDKFVDFYKSVLK